MTIREELRLNPVADIMFNDTMYTEGPTKMVAPELILGLELELENFTSRAGGVDGFTYTNDGSLRNNGREAITAPTKAKFLETLLTKFFAHHKVKEEHYSERCSTHVHMNVQDMTFSQLKVLAMLYQTMERLLFEYVGHDRKQNIFCVPWYESGLTPSFVDKLTRRPGEALRRWVKYSALNFLPVIEQGTVEFRHLHGTCDMKVLLGWINLLSCLHRYAKEHTFEELRDNILEMNTVSNYDKFMGDVFQQHVDLLQFERNREQLNFGVVDTKLMLIQKKESLIEERLAEQLLELQALRNTRPNLFTEEPIRYAQWNPTPIEVDMPPPPPRTLFQQWRDAWQTRNIAGHRLIDGVWYKANRQGQIVPVVLADLAQRDEETL